MQYDMKIRVFNQHPNFGKGCVQLLKLCDEYGSLSKAYKAMGMSNSKAWRLIKQAQEDLGVILVHTSSGGVHGGGSILTPEGKDMVDKYERYCAKAKELCDQAFKEIYGE